MTNFKGGEPLPCAEMEGSTEQARPPAKQEQRSLAEASLGTSAHIECLDTWSIKCRRKKLITQFGRKLRVESFDPN
jgi:hypothetical protein